MTNIYGPVAPGECSPTNVIAFVRSLRFDRASYLCLPWSLEELAGTTWANLWIGTRISVTAELLPRLDKDAAGCPRTFSEWHWELGFFDRGLRRHIIEHWVRIDHLSLDLQLAWRAVEIAFHRRCIADEERHLTSLTQGRSSLAPMTDAINRNTHERALRRARQSFAVAARALRTFATMHHLEIPADLEALLSEKSTRAGITTYVQSVLLS